MGTSRDRFGLVSPMVIAGARFRGRNRGNPTPPQVRAPHPNAAGRPAPKLPVASHASLDSEQLLHPLDYQQNRKPPAPALPTQQHISFGGICGIKEQEVPGTNRPLRPDRASDDCYDEATQARPTPPKRKMPPKRKRPPGQEELPVRPRPSSSPSGDEEPQSDSDPADSQPPFFNVSFSTHRVSPLFVGEQALSSRRLDTIARRLRDTLVGDVVRGVQVGLEGDDTSLGRAGSLEGVTIRWFDGAALAGYPQGAEAKRRTGRLQRRGLCFEMRYENALCTALLLPRSLGSHKDDNGSVIQGPFQSQDSLGMPETFNEPDEDASPQFVHLPLLLTRMPTQLKAFVIDFICSTFDCRIGALSLGTRSIVTAWERWIEDVGSPSRGPLAKELVLTLGFHLPLPDATDAPGAEAVDGQRPGLRSVDVIIPAEDIGRFVRSDGTGAADDAESEQPWQTDPRKRSKLSGGSAEEGWMWMQPAGDEADSPELPFTRAIASYLKSHLALDLFHPSVQITRIACGGFALAENRLKVFGLSLKDDDQTEAVTAVQRLLSGLVDVAAA